MRLVGPPILRKCIASPPPAPPSKPPTLAGKPLLTAPQNPCAQFFFAVNPETPPENLTKLLNKAWQYDPITTLRLICYLRTLRGGRKASNDGFFAAALWLYKNHPLTLSCNLREFAGFGSLRDFTEILYRLVNEEDCSVTCKVKDSSSRKETETEIARRAVCKYVQDSTYRFLHERVSDLFADLLKSDLKSLGSEDVDLLSYASVDCPSIDSAYDRHTLLCESIARKVFPQESDPSYMKIKDEHYVYRVRSRLRKDVLSPMRMALKGRTQPEGGRVQAEDYTLVFMKKAYQKLLKMKDNVSKLKYFKIILAMILKENTRFYPSIPLSVIASLNDENIEAKELEWKNLVQSFSKERKLMNSVAVCDISEDMRKTTKNVSVSMGLLISELSNGPWKGTLYGFHQSPKLRKIEGDDIRSKLDSVKQLQCTNKVDVEAILNQLLQVAVSNNLSPEKMVERVFVFTNKDFRKGVNHYWGWNYNAVWGRYQRSGFHRVPEVVFWNIEGLSSSLPTTRVVFHNTVLTLNGFSRSLLAFFLNKEAILRSDEIKSVTAAEDVMQITLAGKGYQNLAVLD